MEYASLQSLCTQLFGPTAAAWVYDSQQREASNQSGPSWGEAGSRTGNEGATLQLKYDNLAGEHLKMYILTQAAEQRHSLLLSNFITFMTQLVNKPACLAGEADSQSFHTSVRTMLTGLQQANDNCSLPSSASLDQVATHVPEGAPLSITELQTRAAAIAEKQAEVQQLLKGFYPKSIAPAILQHKLVQAANASLGNCSVAEPPMEPQQASLAIEADPCTPPAQTHLPPHFHPPTSRLATSQPGTVPGPTPISPPAKAVPLPVEQNKGTLGGSNMLSSSEGIPIVPLEFLLEAGTGPTPIAKRTRSSCAAKPALSGANAAPAGAPGKGLPTLSQVPASGLAAGLGSVAGGSITKKTHKGKKSLKKRAAARHPAAALAKMPMEATVLIGDFGLWDGCHLVQQEEPAPMDSDTADLHGIFDMLLPSIQAPPALPQQQQQSGKGGGPQPIPLLQQELHAQAAANLGTTLQAPGVASVNLQPSCHDANTYRSTAAAGAGAQSPTALQQSQQATPVVTGPAGTQGAASDQALNQMWAYAMAADQQACHGGRQYLPVGEQFACAGGWFPAVGRQMLTADTQPASRPFPTANSQPPFSHTTVPHSETLSATMAPPQCSRTGVAAGRQPHSTGLQFPLPVGRSPTADEGHIAGSHRPDPLQWAQAQWDLPSVGPGLKAPAQPGWNAAPQRLAYTHSAAAPTLPAVHASPLPAAANASLAARTHMQHMKELTVPPQQGGLQQTPKEVDPKGARSHDQSSGNVAGDDPRQPTGNRVEVTPAGGQSRVQQQDQAQPDRKRSRSVKPTVGDGNPGVKRRKVLEHQFDPSGLGPRVLPDEQQYPDFINEIDFGQYAYRNVQEMLAEEPVMMQMFADMMLPVQVI